MAKARAVLKRLKAVRNIRKITRTMELIATARFKKAMDRAIQASAYTQKIAELAADLASSAGELSHPLTEMREERKSGLLLVLTSNRGLCGGYNGGVLKLALQKIREARDAGLALTVEVSGKRGLNFMRFQRMTVDRPYTQFEDKPRFEEIDEIATRYMKMYIDRQIDWVDVAYVKFLSASRQTAVVETLLPLAKPVEKETTRGSVIDYEFLPS